MDKIILQKDDICGECGCEIPKGDWCYSDGFDNLRCAECNEREEFAENYG